MSGEHAMPVGTVAPELAVLVGAVVVLLWALFAPRRLQGGAPVLAVVALGTAAVLAARQLAGPGTLTFSGTYSLDGAAVWAKLLILAVTAVVVALSVAWLRTDHRFGESFTLLLFAALGAILLAGAADLMELILGVLLSSAASYVLAGYHRTSRLAGEAAIKYFLLGALTNGLMLFGAALLFGVAGTTTFTGMARSLAALPAMGGWTLAVAASLVVVGLVFKLGAVPAHAWMPDVAEGSPAPAAAFLTVAGKIGALVVLARLFLVLPEAAVAWRAMAAGLAAATMTLGNLAALWQDDVRRLLGWSSVSQTGYALMALACLGRSALAVPGLLFFLVAYAFANLAAFGVVIRLGGLTGRASYSGLARVRPALALTLAVSFLSLIGIPPLAGFVGKLALFGAAIEAGFTWLAVLAAVNTVVSIAYYARVLGPVYFGQTSDVLTEKSPVLGPPPPSWSARWATVGTAVSALAVLALGLAAEWLLGAFAGVRVLP